MVKGGKKPKTWLDFKTLLNKNFPPTTFQMNKQKERDALQQKEGETVADYINKVPTISLNFISYNSITSIMEMVSSSIHSHGSQIVTFIFEKRL